MIKAMKMICLMCMLLLAPALLASENTLRAGENKETEALYDSLDNAIAQTAQYVKQREAPYLPRKLPPMVSTGLSHLW